MNKKTLLVGVFALGTLATSTNTFAHVAVSEQETSMEIKEFACCGYGKMTKTKVELKKEAKIAKKEAKAEAKAARNAAKHRNK